MTIPASDVDALFDLIEVGGAKLREQNPDHELLQFLAPVIQKAPWTDEVGEKFLAQFDPDDKKTAVTIRVADLHAFNEANNAPTG